MSADKVEGMSKRGCQLGLCLNYYNHRQQIYANEDSRFGVGQDCELWHGSQLGKW